MTDESLKQLLSLAAKATPGPWNSYIGLDDPCAVFTGDPGERDKRIACCIESMHNAAHIAACSPDVISEIVNELLAAREEIKHLQNIQCPQCMVDEHDR